MESSNNNDDLEAFISNPSGRRYWTKARRDVICRIFRQEILDENLTVPIDKVIQAINELGEERTRSMQGRIRSFIYRFRKDRLQVIKTGKPHSTPKRRKTKKGVVESSTPVVIISSESANDDTDTDPMMPSTSSGEKYETDKVTEATNGSEFENKEANAGPDIQPSNENNESDIMEYSKDGTKPDPVDLSSQEKCLDFENNNEVYFNSTQICTPVMISMMKTQFAQELSTSYLSSETSKVDFVTDFLKSKGFENITRETVFTWADAFSKGIIDQNPGLLFNEMTECLVRGVIHGDIDLKFILDSYTDQSDLSDMSFEDLNHTKEIPSKTSTYILPDDGYQVDDLGTLDLSPIQESVVDKTIPSEEGGNVVDAVTPEAPPKDVVVEKQTPSDEGYVGDPETPEMPSMKEVFERTTSSVNEDEGIEDHTMKSMPSLDEGTQVHQMEVDPVQGENEGAVRKMNLRKRKNSQ